MADPHGFADPPTGKEGLARCRRGRELQNEFDDEFLLLHRQARKHRQGKNLTGSGFGFGKITTLPASGGVRNLQVDGHGIVNSRSDACVCEYC